MKLTSITEYIVDLINADFAWKPEAWVAKAEPALDWVSILTQKGPHILIVPELTQYSIEGARDKVEINNRLPIISLYVAYTFDDAPSNDVAPWETCKLIIDTREILESTIITHNYSSQKIAVVEIEGQPIMEGELNNRNFAAITSFTFESLCDSTQESNFIQADSNNEYVSPKERAYMRRLALSGRQLGRRSE